MSWGGLAHSQEPAAQPAELPTREPAAPPAPEKSAPAAPARGPDDRRPVPDYDGRPEPTTAGDVALWVPRVLLFPLYVVSEYVVRRPLGWLISTAEREHWPTLLIDFFTFGDRQGGVVPTFMIDLGMRASVGVYAFWNGFIAEHNDLRLRATYGGSDFWQLRVSDRLALGAGQLALAYGYETRPDNVFYGIGNQQSDERSRYGSTIHRLELSYRAPWFRSSYARGVVELREVELDGSPDCCEDPSVDEQVGLSAFPEPPGMNQVYDVAGQGGEVVLDTRWPRFPEGLELGSDYVTPPGTGVRLALRAAVFELMGQSLATRRALANGWVHYGASLGGHYDLTGQQRNVSATLIVDMVDPLGSGEVPLTDLTSLGGERPLRGFLAHRFVDRSAGALRLEYRWPVAVWLDGSLLYEAGNVFAPRFSGFELSQLRSSYGIGLSAVGAQDHPFQVLIALGTEPWVSGGRVDSFRFVFGSTAGF